MLVVRLYLVLLLLLLLLLLLELVMLAKLYTSERNQLMRRWCAREEWRVVSRTKRENATYYR